MIVQELIACVLIDYSLDYTVKKRTLRFKGRLYIGVSAELQKKLILALHEESLGDDSGVKATYQRLKAIFIGYDEVYGGIICKGVRCMPKK